MAGERVVLEEVLKQLHAGRAPTLSKDKYFEVFCVDQLLKDFDLTYEDIRSGIFDGSNDGGIDWAYLFMNGAIVNMDEDVTLPTHGDLDMVLAIGQSKNEDTFKEAPIDRLKSRLDVLLKLNVEQLSLLTRRKRLEFLRLSHLTLLMDCRLQTKYFDTFLREVARMTIGMCLCELS